MKRPKVPPWLFILWAAMAAIAYFVSRWLHINYWLALGIIVVAMLVNGFLAEWEDNQPGGFNAPRERDR
jgi:hypothetical protein